MNPCLSPEINVSSIFERYFVSYVVNHGIKWPFLSFCKIPLFYAGRPFIHRK